MPVITTVLGDISPDKIGHCQCHEHLLISRGVSAGINPALCIDDLAASTKEAQLYCAAGGNTVVDAQPGGCNRMEEGLLEIAEKTGLHIVAATGFHKACFYPKGHWLHTFGEEELYRIFCHELCTGMYTGSDTAPPRHYIPRRAGIIKTALEAEGLTPLARGLFAAAARAAQSSGASVMVHVDPGADPLLLLRYLQSLGLAANRVIFSHMDRACPDISVHKTLCREGCFAEYDTIARPRYHSDEAEAAIFLEMLSAGFEDNLLFALDPTRERLLSYGGTPGLCYILQKFIPLLQAKGVTPQQIYKISHTNCKQALARPAHTG